MLRNHRLGKKKRRGSTKPRELTAAYLTACPHPEKRGYRTKGAAKRALKTKRGLTQRDSLHPYRCRCGLFHLGHKVPAAKRLQSTEDPTRGATS